MGDRKKVGDEKFGRFADAPRPEFLIANGWLVFDLERIRLASIEFYEIAGVPRQVDMHSREKVYTFQGEPAQVSRLMRTLDEYYWHHSRKETPERRPSVSP
ncbi:MAG: hypothetical protein ACOC9X_04165 [bacterium]